MAKIFHIAAVLLLLPACSGKQSDVVPGEQAQKKPGTGKYALTIELDSASKLSLNDDKVTAGELRAKLREELEAGAGEKDGGAEGLPLNILLKTKADTRFAAVCRLLEVCNDADIKHVYHEHPDGKDKPELKVTPRFGAPRTVSQQGVRIKLLWVEKNTLKETMKPDSGRVLLRIRDINFPYVTGKSGEVTLDYEKLYEYLCRAACGYCPTRSHQSMPITVAARDPVPFRYVVRVLRECYRAGYSDVEVKMSITASITADKTLDKAILRAVEDGDIAGVKELVKKGADVNSRDSSGAPLLHLAVEGMHVEIVELLISEGADVNAKDSNGNTPLYLVRPQRYEIRWPTNAQKVFDLLLAKGADINAKYAGGRTLLHEEVVTDCQQQEVDFYVSKGADVNAVDNEGRTPLDIAVEIQNDTVSVWTREGVEKALRKHGARLSNPLRTELLIACKRNDFADVIEAFDKGANIDTSDFRGRTSLHIAAENGHEDIVEYLLRKRAWPNPKDKAGRTPLDVAETDEVRNLLRANGAKTGKELREEGK